MANLESAGLLMAFLVLEMVAETLEHIHTLCHFDNTLAVSWGQCLANLQLTHWWPPHESTSNEANGTTVFPLRSSKHKRRT